MTRALILSGRGHYADAWRTYDETSRRLARIMESSGIDSEVSGEVHKGMADLMADPSDLLVLNIGDPALNNPDEPRSESEERGRRGLLEYLGTGRPLLGVHAASTSLRGVPEWKEILGGVWVRGHSFHPDYGQLRIRVCPLEQPRTIGLADFDILDERYTDLCLAAGNVVLVAHVEEGRANPLVWARTYGTASARVSAIFSGTMSHRTTHMATSN